jgi:hypothetical protein
MNIKEKYYRKKIKDFLKIVKDFCDDNNINYTFKDFLFYNKNEFCSPAYYHLHLAPKIFLVNSKTYMNYHNSLDVDFKQDILTEEDIRKNKILLKSNDRILNMLRTYQKNDSIL